MKPTPPATPAAAPQSPPTIAGIDSEQGLRLLRGDRALYNRLLHTFATCHRADICALRTPAPAGSPGDEIARRLHALKGSAAAIGAAELQRQAADIDARLHGGAELGSLGADLDGLADALQHLIQQIEDGLQA